MNKSEQHIKNKLPTPTKYILLLIGIILIAAILRAPFTSVGPLIEMISVDLGLNHTLVGLLTTFPLLAFAFISPLAPKLSDKWGMEKAIFVGIIIVIAGILFRFIPSIFTLFTGTIIIGIGIAIGNVLLPGLIKRDFPLHIGIMTGIYSVSMNVFAALASGISIPLADSVATGWRGSLLTWSLLSFIALIVWIPQLRSKRVSTIVTVSGRTSIWKSKLAWQVTAAMGLQSFIFYSVVTWLPEVLSSLGMSSSTAGWMLSLLQLSSVPITFVVPILSAKYKDQRSLVFVTFVCFFLGFLLVLIGSTILLPVGVILIGVGTGAAFGLSTMFFILRTRNSQQAAQLSGMAQSIGYLLAATGPLFVGLVHDLSGSWSLAIGLLLFSSILFFLTGLGAAKNVYISDETTTPSVN